MARLLTILGALVLTLALAAPAWAAPPPVTNTNDSGAGSLRASIAGAVDGDTVVVPAGTYRLTSGELQVGQGITISGAGAGSTFIQAAPPSGTSFRVLHVTSAALKPVTITGVTISGGQARGASAGSRGGGIFSEGTAGLSVSDSVVSGNQTFLTIGDSSQVGGGGIYNTTGPLSISDTIVVANDVEATATGFIAATNGGGGVYQNGAAALTLTDSTIASNSVKVTTTSTLGGRNGGGGVYVANGGPTITSSTIAGNTVDVSDLGAGASASGGGGIYNGGGGLSLTRSSVAGNSATVRTTGGASGGGGVYTVLAGTPDIAASTVSSNVATLTTPTGNSGGGGVYYAGRVARLTNSTLSGNKLNFTAGSPSSGGGGYFGGNGADQYLSVTVFGNSANAPGGGLFNLSGVASTLTDSIVASNTATAGANCSGVLSSGGHNLESASTCNLTGPGDKPSTDPRLGPLASNGGPTQTHALLPESPAIDAGSGCPATDQRGVVRPQGAACDIGAYEFDGSSSAASAASCFPPGTTTVTVVAPAGLTATAVRYRIDGGAEKTAATASGAAAIPLPVGTHGLEYWGEYTGGAQEKAHHSARFTVASCPVKPPGGRPPPSPGGLPPPVLGKLFNVEPLAGDVFYSPPPGTVIAARSVPGLKGRRFFPLREARQLPIGSLLDTRKGRVRLVSASTQAGKTFTGDFAAGVFQVLQSRSTRAKGLTELRLKGASFRRCGRAKGATVSAARLSRRAIRRLRSKVTGRFRTRGRYSAATVRGTSWLTADRCDGTLTKVTRGRVAVRDLGRRRTILVRAGKSYLAKAR